MTIESDAFNGLTNLTSLDLGSHRITSIESGDFHGLTNLTSLDLEDNQIASIANGAFNGTTNLQTLKLEHNVIATIESGAFAGLSNLESLDLRSNQIANITGGALNGLTNLQSLRLEGNSITSIANGAFAGLANLQTLVIYQPKRKFNLTNATFENLSKCDWFTGFCVFDRSPENLNVDLILDGAVLSNESFAAILSGLTAIEQVSIVNTTFSDENPTSMDNLLGITTLNSVTVDPQLYDLYTDAFQAFDAMDGKSVTIALHPSRAACDFDQNGLCNVDDIDMLMNTGSVDLGVPVDGGENERFDLDGSGVIDENDISQWLELAATENRFAEPFKFGDANLDGAVDPQDLNALGQAWLGTGAGWSTGDFNGDGLVNEADLNRIGQNWLQTVATVEAIAAVPEPTTSSLYLLAAVLLILQHHRRRMSHC